MNVEGPQCDPRAVILTLQAEEEIKKEEKREEECRDLVGGGRWGGFLPFWRVASLSRHEASAR